MRRIGRVMLAATATFALAACGESATESDETVMAEETVVEEPSYDVMAEETDDAANAREEVTNAEDEIDDDAEATETAAKQ